ncbi:MAG: 3'-5' exonuclease [Pseudomonadota bacterium]|nr:3'-5' exonuclease [Pseudomonadota bacterium]
MAIFFPALPTARKKMQPGERRFAERLESHLEDDYLCWYDIGIGNNYLHPDFTLLHPGRGLLILEVKDWKADTIREGDKESFTLLTGNGLKVQPNPLEQARQYAHQIVNLLVKDPQLTEKKGNHLGKLAFPWGYGVVFTNLTQKQIQALGIDQIIDERLILNKDDLLASVDAEDFQTKLWNMFNYQFGDKLSQPQIDRIRWHLWPEVRVNPDQRDLFGAANAEDSANDNSADNNSDNHAQETQQPWELPDIVRVMDYQQEQLARSLGEGHRVIHGVAGSGKTMILGYRCLHLAKVLHKPILVLCFNITLAAKLRSYVAAQGVEHKVQVYHFHDWCAQQLRSYQAPLPPGDAPHWEKQVMGVIHGVDKGLIPRAQYGAVMIDEAHDFEADWLRLITGMVDPETNTLLLLYDDAQSIYHRSNLGFTLSSVGVQARGRTTVLKLNYRNTRQILQFAYEFAQHYLQEHASDEDHLPLIKPESGGVNGALPIVREFSNPDDEARFIARCITKWHQDGCELRDIAVVYRSAWIGARVAHALDHAGIPYLLTHDKAAKAQYDPLKPRVSLLTMHSSKGLEFNRVIIAGVGEGCSEDDQATEVRLLYIAMTRAMQNLLITSCKAGYFSEQLAAVEGRLLGVG